jgi:hypothetical protein
MKIGGLLQHLGELETAFAIRLTAAADRHRDEHDVDHQCRTFAIKARKRAEQLEPRRERYGGSATWASAVAGTTDDLLEDLRALYLRAEQISITWTMVAQAAMALRDPDLIALARGCKAETERQAKWFTTRIKSGAPQALLLG